ncbi:hypothetical protein HU719_009140 [Pseudomonas sp. SWRI107]|uniref:RHS repeat-associated core domain-containing protein n=1 Tax=Pseudomonas farsensis TaxID=2745492 RepID=UPI0016456793|nr:RHS repeat-associated core domain-containing protein [Pseudomonas farsensis]MBV4531572.1 hypothetical protein [Pseudomonas farsensis]
MGRLATRVRFFYQNNKLVTFEHGLQLRSILRDNDRPLAELSLSGGNGVLATDDHHSVLVKFNGDTTPAQAYTAYGQNPAPQSARPLCGFNGEYYEATSACYLLGNGYRAYSPALMRFHSPDSWAPFGSGRVNAYAYCSADPINHCDPSGHVLALVKPAPAVANVAPKTPGAFRPTRSAIHRRFEVDHYETLTTTTIKTVGRGRHAQDQAETTTRRTMRTTSLFEVNANPQNRDAVVYVTQVNLDSFLETRNELFLAKQADALGISVSVPYINNLKNRLDGLSFWGNALAARAANPNDLSAYQHGAFRTSPGGTAIRLG